MRRRTFIAGLGSAAAWPLAARAQQGARRVGVLMSGAAPSENEVRDELQRLGWIEGRNLRLDFRVLTDRDLDRRRAAAADVVRLAADVIVASGGDNLLAAEQATKSIPIVFVFAGDPAETGRVKNVARPEGNATGFAIAYGSLGGKWLQLLKEAAPNVVRVAYLFRRGGNESYLHSVEAAARELGVQLVTVPVSDAADVKAAIESFATEPNSGLLSNPGILSPPVERELIRLAQQHRLPTISRPRVFAADGGLMSYEGNVANDWRGALSYVDRILRGAKVSDLAVQYPTTFKLTVNLKTAKAIGLAIPESFLLRADELIE